MRKLLLAGLASSALAVGIYTPAEASGGCGPFGHRGFYGYCRPNGYGGYGFHRPFGYGYGFHRPFGYGYGGQRHFGYYRRW